MQTSSARALGPLLILLILGVSCAPQPATAPPRLLAHRGIHQTFDPQGIRWDTCTASRARPVSHGYIENTLPSMEAAFQAGAEVVELDVHATSDGHLAVFHDHMLECRTDGSGKPEDHSLAELRLLDLGYGYTADGGQTFPLRGRGVGLLVTLPEVYQALPDRRFLIHIKSGREEDGARVAEVLRSLPADARARQIVYGGRGADEVKRQLPEITSFSTARVKDCLKRYLAVGWLGVIPERCGDTWVLVPSNYAGLLWGFPRRFEARMATVGTEVVLAGPIVDGVSTGIDSAQQLRDVPEGFSGWIWTNRIEEVGPAALASRRRQPPQ